MPDRLAAFIVGEGNWLPIAMTIAAAAAATGWARRHDPPRERAQRAMNVFVGTTLLVMGLAHLAAVTVKLQQGTLAANTALLYLIGIAIVIPATLLILNADRARSVPVNLWMAATLVVLGLINIPLAIPALLSVAHRKSTRPASALIITIAFLLVNAGLFTGGMLFMLSGARTFEEFQRLR